jgi:hypothetical protein
MTCMAPVPKDHPLMVAWEAYKASDEYANSKKWAAHPEHLEGSLWTLFMAGFQSAQGVAEPPEPLVSALIQAVKAERDEFHERCNNSYSTDALILAKERVRLCKTAVLAAMRPAQSPNSIRLYNAAIAACIASDVGLPMPAPMQQLRAACDEYRRAGLGEEV